MLEQLDAYYNDLKNLSLDPELKKEKVAFYKEKGLWEFHELSRALLSVLCHQTGIDFPTNWTHTEKGAIALFKQILFPWKGIPYPFEEVLLASYLEKIGKMDAAKHMLQWVKMFCLSHNKEIMGSLFSQEKYVPSQEAATAASQFYKDAIFSLDEAKIAYDQEYGLARFRDEHTTVLSTASGVKSGMGCFLKEDFGVINYGPHEGPVDQYCNFGLAGRPIALSFSSSEDEYHLSHVTHLSCSHPQNRGLPMLQDSGFSGMWINAKNHFKKNSLSIDWEIEGISPLFSRCFLFFGKGTSCVVDKSKRLIPRSLHRYTGPAATVSFAGSNGSVTVEPCEKVETVEVIPLSGEKGFWSAEFLAIFRLKTLKGTFNIY